MVLETITSNRVDSIGGGIVLIHKDSITGDRD